MCVSRHTTWSQSRSCPWLLYVYWTDDHRTAERHQQPMKHNTNAHKRMENDGHLFAHRAVCTHKRNLWRCNKKNQITAPLQLRVMLLFKEQHTFLKKTFLNNLYCSKTTTYNPTATNGSWVCPFAKSPLITLQALVIFVSLELWGVTVIRALCKLVHSFIF